MLHSMFFFKIKRILKMNCFLLIFHFK